MERTLRRLDEALPKLVNEFRVKLTDLGRGKFDLIHETGTSRKINSRRCQRFVHRQGEMSVPPQSGFIAKYFCKRLTENNAGIFNSMMPVHLEITATLERQIDERVSGKKREHVIEKAQTRGHFGLASAIEIERE